MSILLSGSGWISSSPSVSASPFPSSTSTSLAAEITGSAIAGEESTTVAAVVEAAAADSLEVEGSDGSIFRFKLIKVAPSKNGEENNSKVVDLI